MVCDVAPRVGQASPIAAGRESVRGIAGKKHVDGSALTSAQVAWTLAKGPRRVLIAEDWEELAESMRILLEAMGCETHVARDGHAALAALRETPLDLAILDIDMPGLDGWEVASQITQEDGRPPRLVALTGRGQPSDRRRSLESGFDEHLLKPLTMTDLHRLLS